jgi:hypothetical protein
MTGMIWSIEKSSDLIRKQTQNLPSFKLHSVRKINKKVEFSKDYNEGNY